MFSKVMKSIFVICLLVGSASSFASANCSSSVAGLERLAKSARFLPDGMSEKIYGTWKARSLLGRATIKLSKQKGSVMLYLHAKSGVLGIDMEDHGVATFCFTNQSEITVHVRLFDKDEKVTLRVEAEDRFRVLDGRLKGVFRKSS
ncbi:MAG: hypothetical protein HRT45_11040 [Bdellovibrionales bacterium]|nr:hypothetical protein [Bdellovibrionales bacterium]